MYEMGSGVLFQGGGILSQALMFVIVLLSFWNLFYALLKYRLPVFLKAVIGLVFYFSIYGFIPIMKGETFLVGAIDNYEVPSYNYLKLIYMSLLPIFPFYVYAKKRYLTEKVLSRWFYVFLIIVLIQYVRNIQTAMLVSGIDGGEFTNNISYSLLALFPMMLFLRMGLIRKYLILGLLFLLILYGMKRGAIIIALITLIWYIYRTFKTSSKKIRIKFVVIFCLFVALISLFTVKLYHNSSYFQYRIEQTVDGDASGRDLILENLLNYFETETTSVQKLLGLGANATLKLGDNYAHNDWVEILINQGFLGVIIYLIYWIMLYYSWKSLDKNTVFYTIIGMVFLNIFLSSFFSMSYASYSLYTAICIGYCFSINNRRSVHEKNLMYN